MSLPAGQTRNDDRESCVKKVRRRKRDKVGCYNVATGPSKPPTLMMTQQKATTKKAKKKSKALKKHGGDAPSGGAEALLPSLIGLTILVCGVMAKMGFRGRASVAGIDLGTTNSVICVQALSSGVGEIDCIKDPHTDSPIVPSVVSFLDVGERPKGKKEPSILSPHPSFVLVGQAAKQRIETHPHETFYHAKRVLGRAPSDTAVAELQQEVEFEVHTDGEVVAFGLNQNDGTSFISPVQVGSYVVDHLIGITKEYLGHENVKSAVIAVPAKFDAEQRRATAQAFQLAGVTVTRILEEPVAAALAYGLHRKPGVDYILVYDFGGGTLDVSLLHVTDGFADVMGSDGDDQLGGADFDAAVSHHFFSQHGPAVQAVSDALSSLQEQDPHVLEETLSKQCIALHSAPLCTLSSLHTLGEKIKIVLSDGEDIAESTCFTTTLVRPESSDDLCASLVPVRLSLALEEFDQIAQSLYERAVLPVQRLLFDLSLDTSEVDEVVMVGGTTRMPQIRRLVREAMGVSALNTHIDPDITVAYGAASVID